MTFEDAARRMLGAPPEANVSSEMENTSFAGCDTCGWDDDAPTITISAYLYERYANGRLKPKAAQVWSREFTNLPELWSALFEKGDDTP